MYKLPLEKINNVNEEIRKSLPILDFESDLFASSMNLLISENYYDGYKLYRQFKQIRDSVDKQVDFKIVTFVSCGLINKKMFTEAREVIEENISNYPNEISLNNNLAVVLFNLGQPLLAIDRLKMVLNIDCDNKEVENNYKKITEFLNLEGRL
jgi:tetratricopeptide (TPR) repeat protein